MGEMKERKGRARTPTYGLGDSTIMKYFLYFRVMETAEASKKLRLHECQKRREKVIVIYRYAATLLERRRKAGTEAAA